MFHPMPNPYISQMSSAAVVAPHPTNPNICTELEPLPATIPDTVSMTVESIPKEKLIYTDNISESTIAYIKSAKKLKFKHWPCKNVIFPWLDDIVIRSNEKSFDEEFKRYQLMKAFELDY